jgi:4-hydroxybutyrate CoA-transferase
MRAPGMPWHFRHNAMFIGGNVREAIHEGRTDCTPIYLSEIEGLQRYLVVEIAAQTR